MLMKRIAILAMGLNLVVSADPGLVRTPWMKLFNGKDLNGWGYDSEYWRVEDGTLIGQGKSTFNTFCHFQNKYSDFVLVAKTRLWESSAGYTNSGIQYRSVFIDSITHRMQGYQSEIGEGYDGAMYPENGYPKDVGAINSTPDCKSAIKRNDWNQVVITADGNRIKHQLNGVTCLEFTGSIADGYIGLQLNTTTMVMKVDFKDLYIRPLNGSFAIPDSLVDYLDENFTTGLAGPLPGARNLQAGLFGNMLILDPKVWNAHDGTVGISVLDPQGRLQLSRPVPIRGNAPVTLALPSGAYGNHVLRVSQDGRTISGIIRPQP